MQYNQQYSPVGMSMGMPLGMSPMGMSPMGMSPEVAPAGYFTAPWWYYAMITTFIIFALYYTAPPVDTGSAKPSKKAGFSCKKKCYSE